MKELSATNKVEIFPQKGGLYYIKIPLKITKPLQNRADRGLIAIKAHVGDYTWDSWYFNQRFNV